MAPHSSSPSAFLREEACGHTSLLKISNGGKLYSTLSDFKVLSVDLNSMKSCLLLPQPSFTDARLTIRGLFRENLASFFMIYYIKPFETEDGPKTRWQSHSCCSSSPSELAGQPLRSRQESKSATMASRASLSCVNTPAEI